MITKFKTIQGVGSFLKWEGSNDDFSFNHVTLVFSENGYGKSTLASILKSIRDADPNILKGRKTLGNSIKQKVVLQRDNSNDMVFENGAWKVYGDGEEPQILIFDQEFIHNNLFILEPEHNHKKQWHRIIIGDQGRIKAEKLAEVKKELKEKKKLQREYYDTLNERIEKTKCGNYLTIEDKEKFVIEEYIKTLQLNIKAKENEINIKEIPKFQEIEPIALFDEDLYRKVLDETHDTLHQHTKELVLSHIQRNIKNPELGENLIRECIEQRTDNCPFCGQPLENAKQLMDAYSIFFDEERAALQTKVNGLKSSFSSRNVDFELSELFTSVADIRTILSRWSEYLESKLAKFQIVIKSDDTLTDIAMMSLLYPSKSDEINRFRNKELSELNIDPLDINHKEVTKAITSFRLSFIDKLDEKAVNLNAKPNKEFLVNINNLFRNLNYVINNLNIIIRECNDNINVYFVELDKGGNLDELKNELKSKEEQIKRFSKDEKDWCDKYNKICRSLSDIEGKHNAFEEDLSKYAKDIFEKYQGRINEILPDLSVDFQIAEIKQHSDNRSNEAWADFGLIIKNTLVPISPGKQPSACFKNTLSEGEKSSLAFAFFMAHIEQQEDLDRKIVVFDDPLSSLDSNRRTGSTFKLLEISQQVDQLVILSHNESFLFTAYGLFKQECPKTLMIKKDSKNGSWFVKYNVEEACLHEQHHRINSMRKYMGEDYGPSPSDMQKKIRESLETSLQFKYYPELIGIYTYGKQLDWLEELSMLDRELLLELRQMNNLFSPIHHGEFSGRLDEIIKEKTREEIIPWLRKTLSLLKKI